MSDEYLYGYEAMKPILAALGIDIDAKKFAMQHITLDLPHDHYPTLIIRCAPNTTLFEDEAALKALEGANVIVWRGAGNDLDAGAIERIVRQEISHILQGEMPSYVEDGEEGATDE